MRFPKLFVPNLFTRVYHASVARRGMYAANSAMILTFLTVLIMGGQLREARRQTRVTERPWIRFRYQGEEKGLNPELRVNVYQPIVLPIAFMNVGATPALDTEAKFVVEVLPIDKEPEFPSDLPPPKADAPEGPTFIGTRVGTTWASGVIYPNQPATFKAERLRYKDNRAIPWNVHEEEYKSLEGRKAYVVIWGKVWYKDIFGTDHWVNFCNPTAFGELEIMDHDRYPKCAHYNNADTNDGSKFTDFLKFW